MNNWDKYRANQRKAASGGNYRAWDGGKGDIDRSSPSRTSWRHGTHQSC